MEERVIFGELSRRIPREPGFISTCEAELQNLMQQVDAAVVDKYQMWQEEIHILKENLKARDVELSSTKKELNSYKSLVSTLQNRIMLLEEERSRREFSRNRDKDIETQMTSLKRKYEEILKDSVSKREYNSMRDTLASKINQVEGENDSLRKEINAIKLQKNQFDQILSVPFNDKQNFMSSGNGSSQPSNNVSLERCRCNSKTQNKHFGKKINDVLTNCLKEEEEHINSLERKLLECIENFKKC